MWSSSSSGVYSPRSSVTISAKTEASRLTARDVPLTNMNLLNHATSNCDSAYVATSISPNVAHVAPRVKEGGLAYKMKNSELKHEITEDVVKAALENPNGWVYKIEGSFGPAEYVPPEAVVGAWKVDEVES